MKKMFVLVLVFAVLVSVCACANPQLLRDGSRQIRVGADQKDQEDDRPAREKYRLVVFDSGGILESLESEYEAGEEVNFRMRIFSGIYCGAVLNDEYIGEMVYGRFTMPARDSILYTAPNLIIRIPSRFLRAGFVRDRNVYSGALNDSKSDSDGQVHLPIYKFDTLADFEEFKGDFCREPDPDLAKNYVRYLSNLPEIYDEEFFERHSLVLVYIDAAVSSYDYSIDGVIFGEDSFCLQIRQTFARKYAAKQRGACFVITAVQRNSLVGFDEFDAVLIPAVIKEQTPICWEE